MPPRRPTAVTTSPNVWDNAWAANPEASKDFSYRAIHVMTDLGKQVVAKYYGQPQKRAYFQGCSTGGRQALMEVQRYPKDYDGVIAGAPVYTLATQTSAVWRNTIFLRDGANLDGRADQTSRTRRRSRNAMAGTGSSMASSSDPRACKFDPAQVQCPAGTKNDTCLSPVQVKAVRDLYTGHKTPDGQTSAYPPEPRRRSGLADLRLGRRRSRTSRASSPVPRAQGLGGLRPQLFGNPDFDLKAFNFDKDYVTLKRSAFAAEYEAKDPDISPFINNGGKLLMWHGMDDPGPSAIATIEYYEQMKATTAAKVKALDSSARFFVLPGRLPLPRRPGRG